MHSNTHPKNGLTKNRETIMNTSLTKLTSQLRLILAASVAAGSVVATPALAQEENNAKDVVKKSLLLVRVLHLAL